MISCCTKTTFNKGCAKLGEPYQPLIKVEPNKNIYISNIYIKYYRDNFCKIYI